MSESEPTWYGEILRSYAAWISAAITAAAAGWSLLLWALNNQRGDGLDALGWAIVAFVMVGAASGLVLSWVSGLPGVSGLVTLGGIVLGFITYAVSPPLGWSIALFAPGLGAAVATTPMVHHPAARNVYIGAYTFVLLCVVYALSTD
ncbi:hypothetical protein [Nocardioides sp. NPDC006273]|uniref:hypothetical protein n=1 Tax=Nocardioides sp. NPDC006273 TaxID=3155598 RepID=UPI0033AE87F3